MVESTHDVWFADRLVIKRYRSWLNGEADREWRGLSLLDRTVPGLAPHPLERRIENGTPIIVMTRLPGVPLGSSALNPKQLAGLAKALKLMFAAAPPDELQTLTERRWGPSRMVAKLRAWIDEARPVFEPTVEEALRAAKRWLGSSQAMALGGPLAERAFTNADGNIGNFIWDGERCYVVDFEDSGVSDPVYEIADLVEHVSVWLPGLIKANEFATSLALSNEQERRLLSFRRLIAVFWLLMLLPGNPGHDRNPPGSLDRQVTHVLGLL